MISVVVGLLLYSVAMLVAAPPLLRAMTCSGNAPRLGVVTWLSAIGTVVGSWVATSVMVIIEVISHWTHPRTVAASCLARLQRTMSGDAGIAPQITLLAIAAAVTVAAAIIGVRLATAVLGMRARAHEHARAVRLVGHRTGEADVVMVEAAKAAAYCVAGRPPAIVVTSAARAALDDRQLAAVLAHERAHLAGHHSVIVSALRALAAVFPRLSLITEGAQQVSRLLEMCADDVAARRHSSRALLSGLITLSTAVPVEALAAADLAVLARAERERHLDGAQLAFRGGDDVEQDLEALRGELRRQLFEAIPADHEEAAHGIGDLDPQHAFGHFSCKRTGAGALPVETVGAAAFDIAAADHEVGLASLQ